MTKQTNRTSQAIPIWYTLEAALSKPNALIKTGNISRISCFGIKTKMLNIKIAKVAILNKDNASKHKISRSEKGWPFRFRWRISNVKTIETE